MVSTIACFGLRIDRYCRRRKQQPKAHFNAYLRMSKISFSDFFLKFWCPILQKLMVTNFLPLYVSYTSKTYFKILVSILLNNRMTGTICIVNAAIVFKSSNRAFLDSPPSRAMQHGCSGIVKIL